MLKFKEKERIIADYDAFVALIALGLGFVEKSRTYCM